MPDTSLPRVLVVEDNDSVREVLAVLLRREGYGVVLAANGDEALHRLRAGPRPDLILLDMLMPILDGWHLLERLKQQGPQPPPPILVVTSTILSREWASSASPSSPWPCSKRSGGAWGSRASIPAAWRPALRHVGPDDM